MSEVDHLEHLPVKPGVVDGDSLLGQVLSAVAHVDKAFSLLVDRLLSRCHPSLVSGPSFENFLRETLMALKLKPRRPHKHILRLVMRLQEAEEAYVEQIQRDIAVVCDDVVMNWQETCVTVVPMEESAVPLGVEHDQEQNQDPGQEHYEKEEHNSLPSPVLCPLPAPDERTEVKLPSLDPVVVLERVEVPVTDEAPSTSAQAAETSNTTTLDKRALHRRAKLEKALHLLQKEIDKMERAELDLDELESQSSRYLLEARLKRRAAKIYSQLCQLHGQSSRIKTKHRPLRPSRIPAFNDAVCSIRRFPDFHEVLEALKTANAQLATPLEEHSLHEEAVRVFRSLGEAMQQDRSREDSLLLRYRIEALHGEPSADPADRDPALRKKLEESRREGQQRLEQVLEKYTAMQSEMKADDQAGKAEHDDTDDDDDQGQDTENSSGTDVATESD